MEPIEEILRYPTRRDDWVVTVLIGGALTLFGFLIIPAIIVTGYVLAVIRRRVDGDEGPPAWGGWVDLFVDGLKAWVVGIVYAIVPMLIGAAVFASAIAAMATGSATGMAAGAVGFGFGSIVWLAVALAFFYPFPASLANLATTGRLGAAFDLDTIRPVVSTRAYAVPWLLGLAVLVVAGVVGGAVNAVPIVGWILGAVFLFYVDVVLGAVWGVGFADGLEASRRTAPSDESAGTT